MNKMMNIIFVAILSMSLTYCGSSDGDGTNGGLLEFVDGDGVTHTIAIPAVEVEKTGADNLHVTISIDGHTGVFSHFELERKVDNGSFAMHQTMTDNTHTDSNVGDGTYTYRAKAFYLIDGEIIETTTGDEVSIEVDTELEQVATEK